MVYNKIYAQIGEERHITLDPVNYQYDIKQILVIQGETVPEYYEADICNVGDTATLTMIGTAADGVEIPDRFLLDGRNVLVYVVIPGSGGDVQTRYDITIPVDERAEREDIDPSEAEQQQIDSLIAALNSGVARTETAAEEAEGSAGDAEAAAEAVQNLSVAAETLATGEPATVEKTVDEETGAVTLNFGLPRGAKGDPLTYEKLTPEQKAELVQGPILEARDAAVTAVGNARASAVDAVGSAGTTAVGAVSQAGTTQVGAVNQAGATQVQAVEDKGDEVLNSIPQDYTDLVDEVSELSRQLSDIYAPFEFSIEQTVDGGYFTVSAGVVVKNTISGYYAEITPEYEVKDGDVFTVAANSAASAIKTVFWMNENKAVIATSGYTAPVGARYVRFQTSNKTSVATLVLSVEKETANLYRLSGSGSEKTGFVLEKTDSGAKFAKGRGREEAESIFSLINASISQITITEDSGYGWYFVNNVLTKLTGNYYVKYTNLIPVVAGMKFGIYAKQAGGAFPNVSMFTGSKKTSVPWSMDMDIGRLTVGVVTIPDGVDYIMFQSTATTANPALYIEQLYPVNIDKKLLPLKGLKWAALGDSITNIDSNYSPGYLKLFESFEGALITNLAISGSGFCVGAKKFVNRISVIPEDTQIITVTGSFNDLNYQPSGGIGTVDDDDETTICGAMNVFFDALIEAFPTTTIACYMTGPWSYYKPGTTTSDEYVEDLKTICRKKGIPFYDGLYYASNLRPWNAECCKKYYSRSGYLDGDGVHPGSRGMRLIYHQLRSWIVSLVEERDGGLIGGLVPNWLTYYDS